MDNLAKYRELVALGMTPAEARRELGLYAVIQQDFMVPRELGVRLAQLNSKMRLEWMRN